MFIVKNFSSCIETVLWLYFVHNFLFNTELDLNSVLNIKFSYFILN